MNIGKMKWWNYSARWFDKGQEVELTRDIQVWDTVKLFSNKVETKVFKKGTKAQILDYLEPDYQIQIGEEIINNIPGYCIIGVVVLGGKG